MWAILKAVSRPPSSVEFHHVARRPQRLERSVLPGASRTKITCSHSLSVRLSSASFSLAVRGYSNGKNCPTVVWELSPPGSVAAGVPEALPDGKVYPGLDVKLGNTLTGECETVSSPRSDPTASGRIRLLSPSFITPWSRVRRSGKTTEAS